MLRRDLIFFNEKNGKKELEDICVWDDFFLFLVVILLLRR